MIITAKIKVEVPMGFYCKKCPRKERDEKHFMFLVALFSIVIFTYEKASTLNVESV